VRAWALACAGVVAGAASLGLCHCDRGATPTPAPKASAQASSAADLWIDVLEPEKLGSPKPKTPQAVVQALARNRKGKPPWVSPPKTSGTRDRAKAKAKAKTEADALIAGGFVLRQNPAWKLEPPIDWGKNPRKDDNWHYRINSLNALEPLLEAYQLGVGDEYLAVAQRVALDWIDYNLVKNRPNAKKWHDMGSAYRAEVLAAILDAELRRLRPDAKVVSRLVWALDEHAAFLANPKAFTRGNHGFFMMRGLALVLRALPELKRRPRFERYADQQMKVLLASQFAPDGLHLEHSPGYHRFITESFAEVVSAGLFPRLPELAATVERAKLHYDELSHPNGDMAMLGDTQRSSSALRRASRPGPTTPLLRGYPKSGYAVFRSHFGADAALTDDYLLLGAGHHSRGHKHADHLSFEWSFRGVPLLIDSGKYTYNHDDWRDFFRSTRAGNALEVDETDYERIPGPGKSKLKAWGQLGEAYYVVAEQRDQPLAVSQTRVLVIAPGRYLLVIDQMQSKKRHTYRQWFHFHESLDVTRDGVRLLVKGAQGEPWVTVTELSAPDAEIELVRGQTKPRIQGFLSSKYHEKTPRFSAAFRKRAANATWVTLFSPGKVRSAQVSQAADTLNVTWSDAQGRQGLSFVPGADPPVKPLKR